MSREALDAFIYMLELRVGRLLPDELLLDVKVWLCTSELLVDDAVSLCLD